MSVWLGGHGSASSEAKGGIKLGWVRRSWKILQICIFSLLIAHWTTFPDLFFTRLHKAVPAYGGHGTGSGGRRAGSSLSWHYWWIWNYSLEVSFPFWASISVFLEDPSAVLSLKCSQIKAASCPLLIVHRRGFVLGGYLAKKSRN